MNGSRWTLIKRPIGSMSSYRKARFRVMVMHLIVLALMIMVGAWISRCVILSGGLSKIVTWLLTR